MKEEWWDLSMRKDSPWGKDSPCSKLCIYLDGQRTGLIYFLPVPFDFNRTKEFKGAEKEMQYRCAIERQKHTHILCAYLCTLTSVDYFKASNQFHNKAWPFTSHQPPWFPHDILTYKDTDLQSQVLPALPLVSQATPGAGKHRSLQSSSLMMQSSTCVEADSTLFTNQFLWSQPYLAFALKWTGKCSQRSICACAA